MRIGFACKFVDPSFSKEKLEEYNAKSTTITWIQRQTEKAAREKIQSLCFHNVRAIQRVLDVLARKPEELRMFRISSDILPGYTHPDVTKYYEDADFIGALSKKFGEVGEFARNNNIRLSFHPGQFVVLASDNADVVERSIQEFEYHAMVAAWMGYGKQFQDFKCNVHISGRLGVAGMRETWKKLSPEARNIITVENDEITCGVDDILEIKDLIPVVLDIHHHFVKTGEYMSVTDTRVSAIIDSWRGVRPAMHYSYSRDEFLRDHDTFPCIFERKAAGVAINKLRAHSEMYPNAQVNQWALGFLEHFDIMCEAKQKNLAAWQLHKQLTQGQI